MFSVFSKRSQIAKNSKQYLLWKKDIFGILLSQVIPSTEPYYLDSAFSFLQRDRYDTDLPIRVDLFFPNYPLAIDVVGACGRTNYTEAQAHIDRSDWDDLQANLSMKAERLAFYRCPYLIIRDIDPIDAYSLKDRIKALTGQRL